MIRFFRVNDPYRLVLVFIILALIRLVYGLIDLPLSMPEMKGLLLGEWLASGFSMYSETFDYTAPLSAWAYQAIDFLFGRSRLAHWTISGLLVFLQAAIFNKTLLRYKVLPEANYVAAFLYIIFSVATFDFFALSPQLMSLTWVVISMNHLIRKMDNVAGDELFLFPGFYLGIAGLFYMPSVAFFLVFFLAFILIIRAIPRRVFLFIFGWVTAYLIVILLLYVDKNLSEFWRVYFTEIGREKIYYFSYFELLKWALLPIAVFLLAVFVTLGKRESSLHTKTQQFMVLVFLASAGVLLISGTLSGIDLVFFVPVFAFFVTNYFFQIKKRLWRWVIPNVMILGSVLAPFMAMHFTLFSNTLLVEEVRDTSFENKKIMIMGPLTSHYLNGKIAGPFLDEGIGIRRLDDLDYYQKAPVFLDIFRKIRPDIVFDHHDAMTKIHYRFPEVEQMKIEIRRPNN